MRNHYRGQLGGNQLSSGKVKTDNRPQGEKTRLARVGLDNHDENAIVDDEPETPPFDSEFSRQRVQNAAPKKSLLGSALNSQKATVKEQEEIKRQMLHTELSDERVRRQLLDARRMHEPKVLTKRCGSPPKQIKVERSQEDRLQWLGQRSVW